MNKLLCLLPFLLLGCASKSVPDMSAYDLWDFEKERHCERSSQCKSILYGVGDCGNYPGGAAGYFIYSTKIGYKNIRHLKRLAIESLPKKNTYGMNLSGSYELAECLPVRYRKPRLECRENWCQEKWP